MTDITAPFADIDPMAIVESIAQAKGWEFDQPNNGQIAMAIEGQWRTYSVTIAWSNYDETLRMVCTIDMEPPEEAIPKLYPLLNLVNDQCWSGAFTYWNEQQLMVYRGALLLVGTDGPSPEQVETLIEAAVAACERFYPAFALALWGDYTSEQAIQVAIGEAYGTA
jgi:hypothetical protein